MQDDRPKIVIIAGPTASGKSALAMELVRHFHGEIVNGDSMQVYRGMDIGTAKPSVEEREMVPHHLFDIVDPDQDFNAASYRAKALPLLEGMAARGVLPFVVGGTGLYIKALLGGLLECPVHDPALRESLSAELGEKGASALHNRLMAVDAVSAARIHPNDRVRIVRALEIIQLTGRPVSSLMEGHRFRDRPFRALKICLQIDRERLYHRIERRCEVMMERGLVDETEALLNKGYSRDLKPMKSLGYRHALRILEGLWNSDEALTHLQRDTRRYAKRQLTWFRADTDVLWLPAEEPETIAQRVEAFL